MLYTANFSFGVVSSTDALTGDLAGLFPSHPRTTGYEGKPYALAYLIRQLPRILMSNAVR